METSQNIKTDILTSYIDITLTSGAKPASEFKFCKDSGFSEEQFYNHFNSLNSVENYFWSYLLEETKKTVNRDVQETSNAHHNLLSFYYTLFENLKLNRSYILFLSSSQRSKIELDMKIRHIFIPHLENLGSTLHNPLQEISESLSNKLTKEGLWLQFISVFHFWIHDESLGFEKTDAFIEKSVRLGVDLSESIPSESILDFGKFIYKEFRKFI